MEITLLKALINNMSLFFHLSAHENIKCQPVQKYYQKIEEILKLLKPVLDAVTDAKFTPDEKIQAAFAQLEQSVEELRELLETWEPLMSKLYFVLQVEPLMMRVQASALLILDLLKSYDQCVTAEISKASLELCAQKVEHLGREQTAAVIMRAIKEQMDGSGANSERLVRITTSLNLNTNQDILIEAVALENLKENAEQAANNREAKYVDQIIVLVTRMHDRFVMTKQSQNDSPVPIPPDFCCPLSLELMTDPVIVASGQTYERAFIRKWIDLGLTVCPKTRQMLTHTNLIPNYTVKALIANWCESNNVKLPDPSKSNSLNQPGLLLARAEPGTTQHSGIQPQPHSSVDHSASPDRSSSSSRNRVISSTGIQFEGSPPAHPRSSSEGSSPEIYGTELGLNVERVHVGREDRCVNETERSGQPSMVPSRENSSLADQQASLVHYRRTSASNILSNANFSGGLSVDGNEVASQSIAYSSDVSREVMPELEPAANSTSTQKESELPSPPETKPRNQSIWRRPSDRLLPRIVSTPVNETRGDLSGLEAQVRALVEDLKNTSLDVQRNATAELRLLAKHNTENRIVIANCGAIGILVNLLQSTDVKIQENAVTALLNLSINDNNKNAIANADAIGPLIHALETGSSEAKENAAATLFSLSVFEENKMKIGRSGAIKPLVDLLGSGTPRGKKDAATALFNLSIYHENKARIVQDGAVKYLVDLMDPAAGLVDKAVAVLSNLSTIQEGRTAIGQEGGIPVLVEVVELGSARAKENAAAALLQLCTTSNRFCNMVLQEGAVPPLVALSRNGTPRGKEKAQQLLSYFRNLRHGNAARS